MADEGAVVIASEGCAAGGAFGCGTLAPLAQRGQRTSLPTYSSAMRNFFRQCEHLKSITTRLREVGEQPSR
jgi:hypothetical protein